uniref:Uncharacterized protein n=1 Tax=Mycena chlorophos TaxID=658473 RepID=A0ABQ0L7U9_MYCCL|nr:predicted protein [Mycena chlorophos]
MSPVNKPNRTGSTREQLEHRRLPNLARIPPTTAYASTILPDLDADDGESGAKSTTSPAGIHRSSKHLRLVPHSSRQPASPATPVPAPAQRQSQSRPCPEKPVPVTSTYDTPESESAHNSDSGTPHRTELQDRARLLTRWPQPRGGGAERLLITESAQPCIRPGRGFGETTHRLTFFAGQYDRARRVRRNTHPLQAQLPQFRQQTGQPQPAIPSNSPPANDEQYNARPRTHYCSTPTARESATPSSVASTTNPAGIRRSTLQLNTSASFSNPHPSPSSNGNGDPNADHILKRTSLRPDSAPDPDSGTPHPAPRCARAAPTHSATPRFAPKGGIRWTSGRVPSGKHGRLHILEVTPGEHDPDAVLGGRRSLLDNKVANSSANRLADDLEGKLCRRRRAGITTRSRVRSMRMRMREGGPSRPVDAVLAGEGAETDLQEFKVNCARRGSSSDTVDGVAGGLARRRGAGTVYRRRSLLPTQPLIQVRICPGPSLTALSAPRHAAQPSMLATALFSTTMISDGTRRLRLACLRPGSHLPRRSFETRIRVPALTDTRTQLLASFNGGVALGLIPSLVYEQHTAGAQELSVGMLPRPSALYTTVSRALQGSFEHVIQLRFGPAASGTVPWTQDCVGSSALPRLPLHQPYPQQQCFGRCCNLNSKLCLQLPAVPTSPRSYVFASRRAAPFLGIKTASASALGCLAESPIQCFPPQGLQAEDPQGLSHAWPADSVVACSPGEHFSGKRRPTRSADPASQWHRHRARLGGAPLRHDAPSPTSDGKVFTAGGQRVAGLKQAG